MFGSKKPKYQVIKFEQNLCNASVNDNKVLFVRVNGIVDKADAKFEVPFTHNAFVIKGGGDCRMYKSGNYDVFEDKKEVKNWKHGLSVEIVYIPKDTDVLIRWGTPNKVMYRDKSSGKVIEIGARGQFGISIINPEQFFRKVVGVRKEFDLNDFTVRFGAAVVDEFADVFLTVVNEALLTYDKFDANRKRISRETGAALSEKFATSWGIELVDFIIEQFNISEEDIRKVESVSEEEQQRLRMKEYLAELERLDDKQWEREKYLLNLKQNDSQAYYEVLKVTGTKPSAAKASGASFCSACGHSVEHGAAFCPSCGKKLAAAKNVCPKCGAEAKGDAAFCSKCGHKF